MDIICLLHFELVEVRHPVLLPMIQRPTVRRLARYAHRGLAGSQSDQLYFLRKKHVSRKLYKGLKGGLKKSKLIGLTGKYADKLEMTSISVPRRELQTMS